MNNMEKHVCMPAHLNVHYVCSAFDTVAIISFDPAVFAFMNKLMTCSHINYHVIVQGVNI